MVELIVSLFIGLSISINGLITLRVIKKLEREGSVQQVALLQEIEHEQTFASSQPNLTTK